MITKELITSLFSYYPDAGIFYSNRTKNKVGYVHVTLSNKKYIRIYIKGKYYYAHRLAWLYMTGKFPENEIDHINGNGCDNRWVNLRKASSLDNNRNARMRKDNSSGVCGVHWNKKNEKWRAQIRIINDDGISKQKTIGLFDSLHDAIEARKNHEIKYGYHKNHGLPKCK